MTPAELATIEALANAATPGPWRVDRGDVVADEPCVGVVGIAEVMGAREEADATFIAAARQAVPALVAEARRLRAELAELSDESDTNEAHAQQAEEQRQAERAAVVAEIVAELESARAENLPSSTTDRAAYQQRAWRAKKQAEDMAPTHRPGRPKKDAEIEHAREVGAGCAPGSRTEAAACRRS